MAFRDEARTCQCKIAVRRCYINTIDVPHKNTVQKMKMKWLSSMRDLQPPYPSWNSEKDYRNEYTGSFQSDLRPGYNNSCLGGDE